MAPARSQSPAVTPQKTRLYAQGVQAAVRADDRSGEPTQADAAFVADISTRSMSLYIEHNLTEAEHNFTEPDVHLEPPTRAEDTIGDPTKLYVPVPRALRLFRHATRSAAVRRLAPIALSSLATMFVCWLLWGRAPRPQPAPKPVLAASLPAPAPPRPVLPSAPAVARRAPPVSEAAPALAVASAVTTTPRGGCSARVTSRPVGATVVMGTRILGNTPFEASDLPCGPTGITLTHARYRPANVVVDAKTGDGVFVRMTRPDARLVLRSTPAGATFRINRAIVGAGPREITVPRFETTRIEATLPGRRAWWRVIYLSAPRLEIYADFAASSGARHHHAR